jgi:hypothetical protein
MARIGSVMALGFLLALPMAASAGETNTAKTETEQIAAVSTAPVETQSVAAEKSEKQDRSVKRSEVRGSRTGDPVRFNNPYAFPIQSLPLALPNLTSLRF